MIAALAVLLVAQATQALPAQPAQALVAQRAQAPVGLTPARLDRIQQELRAQKLDGWLFADFRGSDPIAYRVLDLDRQGARTRRWYCLVPARGEPRKLLHAIEPRALDGVPGASASYAGWRVRDRELGRLLSGVRRVAMEYSPRNELPTVARVDGGTLELVRSLGAEVVSSAELVAAVSSTLSAEELADQARTTQLISEDLEWAAQQAAQRVRDGHPMTERELRDAVGARFREQGLEESGPGVSVDAHTADPHYGAPAQGSAVIGRGSVLLLDFATRRAGDPAHAIAGDLTRTYVVGDAVPFEVARVAAVVFQARDAGIELLRKRAAAGAPVTGADVDDEVRRVVGSAGFAERFTHRTGHSITTAGHGEGVNNDDFETRDTRRHLANTCFSVEPGVYLAGRFGVRSEVDVCLIPGAEGKLQVDVRGGPLQTALPALLAP